MTRSRLAPLTAAAEFFTVSWTLFVAAFLYYVVLTLTAIGGRDLSDGFMAVAYGLPVAAYSTLLLARALGLLARLAVPLTPGAQPAVR